jgi:hypothetical protein
MSKELLKLLESRRHNLWKYIVTLGEVCFFLFVFLGITNQYGSVQKMKLHKGRVISKDDADRIWNPYGFQLIDVLPHVSKFSAGH